MEEVSEIERNSFEEAWSEEDFIRCLKQRNCIALVSEIGEQIVGYLVYELHKHIYKIVNMAVHPEYRKKGIGTQLVTKLQSKLRQSNRRGISAEMQETNVIGQVFLRQQLFKAMRILPGGYKGMEEDIYSMEYRLD